MDNHTRSNGEKQPFFLLGSLDCYQRANSHQDFHFSPSQRHSRQESRVWGDYALWVGNLPQQTTVMALRDYFSEPCPRDLLSISYNPDAKYAFVNFGTESARNAAIQQAASQTLDGKRLDCRIRQDSVSRSTKVNYGLNQKGRRRPSWGDRSNELLCKVEEFSHFPESHQSQWGKEKYFIIKSFSIEALYQSLESNQWYVPKRHIDRLNLAFQVSTLGGYRGMPHGQVDVLLTEIPDDSPPDSKQSLFILLCEWIWSVLWVRGDDLGDSVGRRSLSSSFQRHPHDRLRVRQRRI